MKEDGSAFLNSIKRIMDRDDDIYFPQICLKNPNDFEISKQDLLNKATFLFGSLDFQKIIKFMTPLTRPLLLILNKCLLIESA